MDDFHKKSSFQLVKVSNSNWAPQLLLDITESTHSSLGIRDPSFIGLRA